ncbi:MAG: tetratricopeptide repeat protein [Anaerolineae bacterium]
MPDTDKLVFISYRRSTSSAHARLLFDRLRAAGFDAFVDMDTTDAGPFDRVTLSQIGARPHVVLLATANAFGRCPNKRDWLRLELEEAVRLERNVIVLADADMDFHSETSYIPGHLRETFHSYKGLPFLYAYFQAAIDQLINHLSLPLTRQIDLIAPTPDEQRTAQQRMEQIAASPAPTPEQLLAEQLYSRAHINFAGDTSTEDLIADYTEAIRLTPQFAAAYYQRARLRAHHLGDDQGAIADYTEAIRLNPADPDAYYDRGRAYNSIGETDAAIADFNAAIRCVPNDPDIYYELDDLYAANGDLESRISLYTQWIEGDPESAKNAYNGRGNLYLTTGDFDAAVADFNEAIRLNPQAAPAYSNRGEAYFAKGLVEDALKDFHDAHQLDPNYEYPIAGLAITYHALGQVADAKSYWHKLSLLKPWFTDVDVVSKELHWAAPLVAEARKLVAKL